MKKIYLFSVLVLNSAFAFEPVRPMHAEFAKQYNNSVDSRTKVGETGEAIAKSILEKRLDSLSEAKNSKEILQNVIGLERILEAFLKSYVPSPPAKNFELFRKKKWNNFNHRILMPLDEWLRSEKPEKLLAIKEDGARIRGHISRTFSEIRDVIKKTDNRRMERNLMRVANSTMKKSFEALGNGNDPMFVHELKSLIMTVQAVSAGKKKAPQAEATMLAWLKTKPIYKTTNRGNSHLKSLGRYIWNHAQNVGNANLEEAADNFLSSLPPLDK